MLGAIFLVSANLSVVHYSYYSSLAFQNRSASFSIPPARGIIFDQNGRPLVKNVPQFDVVGVSKELKIALNDGMLKLDQLSVALGMSVEVLVTKLNDEIQRVNIFSIADNLQKDQILAIQGLKVSGVYIIPDIQRVYIKGPEFSTVLGYIGKVNKDDLANDSYYTATDVVGRLGIEAQYESTLRGEHGQIFLATQPVR